VLSFFRIRIRHRLSQALAAACRVSSAFLEGK
jgi:hypothetical protein